MNSRQIIESLLINGDLTAALAESISFGDLGIPPELETAAIDQILSAADGVEIPEARAALVIERARSDGDNPPLSYEVRAIVAYGTSIFVFGDGSVFFADGLAAWTDVQNAVWEIPGQRPPGFSAEDIGHFRDFVYDAQNGRLNQPVGTSK